MGNTGRQRDREKSGESHCGRSSEYIIEKRKPCKTWKLQNEVNIR
jgi:hypothetical protein